MTLQLLLAKLAVALELLSVAYAQAVIPSGTYTVYPPDRPSTAQIYALAPVLRRIAACESTGDPNAAPRQFNANGSVLWGIDPATNEPIKRDVGETQINLKAHGDEVSRLGLDVVNSEADNVYYAYLLYKREGTRPWSASEHCWQN